METKFEEFVVERGEGNFMTCIPLTRIQRICILFILLIASANLIILMHQNTQNTTFFYSNNYVQEDLLHKDDEHRAPKVIDVAEEPLVIQFLSGLEGYQKPEVVGDSYGTHQVSSGENLYWIAESYDTTTEKLKQLNSLSSDIISSGQSLLVPLHTLRTYPRGVSITDKELQWLAQMIHAEARGEPYLGQVAVGSVILNRLESSQFPNTMYGVLFQRNAFQPIRNGQFFRPANDQAYSAAIEALHGNDPTMGSLFFFNPSISNDRFMHARPAVVTIGEHRFMY